MIKLIKVYKYKLYPNNKQNTRMFNIASATRFAYNWALSFALTYFKNNKKFISEYDLTKEFTKYKKDNTWLYEYPNNSLKQAVKNAGRAVITTFMQNKKNGTNNEVRFKKKFKTTSTIYLDSCQVKFTNNSVKLDMIALSKKQNRKVINFIRLSNKHKIPLNCNSFINPTVKFDGINWYITCGVDVSNNVQTKDSVSLEDGLGIDLGIKDLAICSNKYVFPNINKTKNVKKLIKGYKHQQRKLSRQMLINRDSNNKVIYTNNINKQIHTLKKLSKHLTNVRTNYIYNVINSILNQKPKFIAIENLNVKGMMKNKHLSKAIQNQKFYEFRRILTYKCNWLDIPLVAIDTFYPSSKKCSVCGSIKKDLKLKDRTYVCECCNTIIDRDYNASINIREEGRRLLSLSSA